MKDDSVSPAAPHSRAAGRIEDGMNTDKAKELVVAAVQVLAASAREMAGEALGSFAVELATKVREQRSAGVAGDHCGPGNECGRIGCPECQQ